MEKEYDVLVVGRFRSTTHDYLGNERSEVGGAVVASGWAAQAAAQRLPSSDKLNPEEADVNERFEGIKLTCTGSRPSTPAPSATSISR